MVVFSLSFSFSLMVLLTDTMNFNSNCCFLQRVELSWVEGRLGGRMWAWEGGNQLLSKQRNHFFLFLSFLGIIAEWVCYCYWLSSSWNSLSLFLFLRQTDRGKEKCLLCKYSWWCDAMRQRWRWRRWQTHNTTQCGTGAGEIEGCWFRLKLNA